MTPASSARRESLEKKQRGRIAAALLIFGLIGLVVTISVGLPSINEATSFIQQAEKEISNKERLVQSNREKRNQALSELNDANARLSAAFQTCIGQNLLRCLPSVNISELQDAVDDATLEIANAKAAITELEASSKRARAAESSRLTLTSLIAASWLTLIGISGWKLLKRPKRVAGSGFGMAKD